jgi:acetyl-CoA synthetase
MYDLKLVDTNGEEVGENEEGELVIDIKDGKFPPGLFRDYHKNDDKHIRAFVDNRYHTGDICKKDEDGYFWFVSRGDDIIKSSGYRIGPFEVESALLPHPAVLECAITGVPDEIRGQVIKATIVLTSGYKPSDELARELQDFVKKTTAPYKYPRVIEFVEALPKTISGKVQRANIRKGDE